MWRFGQLLALLVLLSPAVGFAADGWGKLRLGMTPEEAAEALGDPLFRTSGSGFEVWIYDHNAEALFYGGPLIGWTSPGTDLVSRRVVDVWQAKSGGPDAPTFRLPRWAFPPRKAGSPKNPGGTNQDNRVPLYRPWQ